VKVETLSWLASNTRNTKRYERHVGRLCRELTIKRAAELERLSWYQVRQMEINYMNEIVDRFGKITKLRAIGIDEISVRKGHTYMTCVSDLDKGRPIWIGGEGRREEDLDLFYNTLSDSQKKNIAIVVMDMWKPFRKSTIKHIPHAQIIYDKFHIIRHLGDAMDKVRKQEYRRVNEKERIFIKGQKYTLLSHKANLDIKGKRALKLLFKANKRIYKAYLLKESFGKLWDYKSASNAERFFTNWKSQLRWSRLKPFHQFLKMIERHWHNIVSYCNPNNKVSLGLVEGVNNKIRVIQRRAYGIKDRVYLRLKILTSFLPDL